ncbi:hypothetical protein CBR_g40165 [Chara braunii]|uniref:Uncharacterized protein n=1 Tax=Chara braunii TaxID=69332 RepID=A0A388LT92_CHABU|nr:hypothetical protein CBR_g40165 [Chara braunii]|eukprot:GBG85527.1 hypothetical protein CBR_g40165 [Chara braunii]
MGKIGVHKYAAIPVFTSTDRKDLEAVESALIRTWSPALNSRPGGNARCGKKNKKRPGKKERYRKQSSDGDGKKKVRHVVRGKIIEIKSSGSNYDTVKIVEFLRGMSKKRRKNKNKDVNIESMDGDVWADGWRLMRRLFGETRVKWDWGTRPLRKCKSLFEDGGVITLRRISEASPMTLKLRDDRVGMFKSPWKKKKLLGLGVADLLKYYGAVKAFTTNRSRAKARLMISQAIKEAHGVSVRKRVVARIRFDDRIKKSEVARLVRRKVEGMQLDKSMKEIVRQRARVVWTKCPNVGSILHNHRRFALSGASSCTCAGLAYPKRDGHVHFRIGELNGISPIVKNAKNVPKQQEESREKRLIEEVMEAFSLWEDAYGRPCGKIEVTREEARSCFSRLDVEDGSEGGMEEVVRIKDELKGLVLAPLDRNPGDTLVQCLFLYAKGMNETFFKNESYRICREEERVELEKAKLEYKKRALDVHGEWNEKGRFGDA